MPYFHFVWSDEIIAHLMEHDLTPEDFERVVSNPEAVGKSRSSGLPASWGYTEDGRYIIAIYEDLDGFSLIPVTAFDVAEGD